MNRVRSLAPKTGRPRPIAIQKAHTGTVRAADLENLDAVKQLLVALNDAYASSEKVEALVDAVPCLRARCVKRAMGGQEDIDMPLSRALARIGNAGLENELLTLLEDLTVLQAELTEDPSLLDSKLTSA